MASSQLQQLKSSLANFAQSTEKTGQALLSQRQDFEKSSQQLLALISGSATGKDQEVVAAIEQAKKAVEQAGQSLSNAARIAKGYAGTI